MIKNSKNTRLTRAKLRQTFASLAKQQKRAELRKSKGNKNEHFQKNLFQKEK